MMSNIRIHLLSPQFIRDQVLSFVPVAANLICRNLIDDAILAHCNVDFDRAKIDPDDDCIVRDKHTHKSTMSKYSPRFCSHLHNQVYLIGGFASAAVHESIDTVDMFDPRTKTWKQGLSLTLMPVQPMCHVHSATNATVPWSSRRCRAKRAALCTRRF